MSQWHRAHPELFGTAADPWMQHESYRRAVGMGERRQRDREVVAVLAEVYPGATDDIKDHIARMGGWVCEAHPDLTWDAGCPIDDCGGPGMPRDDVL